MAILPILYLSSLSFPMCKIGKNKIERQERKKEGRMERRQTAW